MGSGRNSACDSKGWKENGEQGGENLEVPSWNNKVWDMFFCALVLPEV
jgi:hypothetical protein